MGAIGGLLGTAGGINGTGIAGPSAAAITPGTNADQLQTAYGGAQNSLQSQQALMAALQSQNGIGNQNQVYGQLQGVANGTGPNPAQAMLNQSTGQNVQNQAALMAGQRGAGANAGLMARQAAQQGAGIQQNAAGQAATMQANQSLNAINAAGNMANNQVANQMNATSANTGAQQAEQGLLQGANSQANNANVSMQGNINAVQGQLANTTMQGQQGLIGGAMQGIGQAMTLAQGGVVHKFADGGMNGGPNLGIQGVDPEPKSPFNLGVDTNLSPPQAISGPSSAAGQFLSPQGGGAASAGSAPSAPVPTFGGGDTGATALQQGAAGILGSGSKTIQDIVGMAQQGASSIMGGGGGGGGGIAALAALSQGGNVGSKLKAGGPVPGQAPVKGNSFKNDKVKALLSPGEGVIDRETMNDKGPVGHAARTLMAIVEAKKKGKK